jgi:putative hemolysin
MFRLSTLIALGVVVFLTIANGLFAMSETAVVSSRRARLQERADRGDHAAARALALANEPNVFLSTVQIGITLIGVVLGAFGGSRFSGPVADLLEQLPGVDRIADTLASVLVVLLITYVSLVIGELVPKRIALNNPESVASVVATPMSALSRAVQPFVWLLGVSTTWVLKLLRVKDSDDPPVTEEEVGVLLLQGALAGVFHPEEQQIAARLFELADDRVTALMVPRPDVIWIDVNASAETIREIVAAHPHSRYPVAAGAIDNLLGVVTLRDLLLRPIDEQWTLPSTFEPLVVVPETTMAFSALETFRQTGQNLTIIIDEYGGVAGILSITDILEALVGEIGATGQEIIGESVLRPDGSWFVDGSLAADELAKRLDLRELPGEAEGLFETTAGFVLSQFGHIPAEGDFFELPGWRFEVIDMDGRRVDKLLVTPVPPPG